MSKINLNQESTRAPKDADKDKMKVKTAELVAELAELQNVMYAESKRSVLVVLQGLDASGKSGVIRNVFGPVNPMGIKVHGFKKPTEEELSHDFLWRVHKHVPQKGMIQIFDRSHYEDVLVTRVLGLVDDKTAARRFEYINAFEQLLQDNGTIIFKFFLHISPERQAERFKERLEDPTKNWKYNTNDLKTSENWDEYMQYYSEVFKHCSVDIPWMIVPSDQKWYKEYLIAKTVVETLRSLKMKYPKFEPEV